jgi:arabinose-5-phosphate isomerase
MRSSLAKDAEVVLDASVEREACPLNLAPTSSTTVALALGDALALAVAQEKGYSPEHFGFNHPSGRLGKRLILKVSDLMHHGENNPQVKPEASITEVILALGAFRLGALNVTNPEGRLIGVITEGDLRRALGRAPTVQWSTLGAAQIMTPNPTTVSPDILAYDALRLMENRPSQISILPVVDQTNLCIGMIRVHDLVKAGL